MAELTYEDVPQETVGATVMSSEAAGIGTSLVESVAVSPISGAVLPANADSAARARAGKAAKRERYRQAAEAGLLTAAQALQAGVITHEQAWQKVIEAQTELALSPDVRGSTQAAALVGRATGAIAPDKADGDSQGNTVTITMTDEVALRVAALLSGQAETE